MSIRGKCVFRMCELRKQIQIFMYRKRIPLEEEYKALKFWVWQFSLCFSVARILQNGYFSITNSKFIPFMAIFKHFCLKVNSNLEKHWTFYTFTHRKRRAILFSVPQAKNLGTPFFAGRRRTKNFPTYFSFSSDLIFILVQYPPWKNLAMMYAKVPAL